MTDTVSAADLRAYTERVLTALDVPAAHATIVADSLVDADLRGVDTHGVAARLPNYVARVRNGGINPRANIDVVSDLGAISVLDADDAFGQIAAKQATDTAIARAADHGVGIVAVRKSNHIGVMGYWTRMMADAGMAGYGVSGAAPGIAPWGGTEKLLGSNPWSWAFPVANHSPVVVDISNGVVIYGKVRGAAQQGKPIPEGWALDPDGQPTTDAQAGVDGSLLPFGGAKGAALTLGLEILASILPGASYSKQVPELFEPEHPQRLGHFFMALKVDAFMPLDEFEKRTAEFIDWVESSKPATGVEQVRTPGQRGEQVFAERSRDGLPMAGRAALDKVADDLGVEGLPA